MNLLMVLLIIVCAADVCLTGRILQQGYELHLDTAVDSTYTLFKMLSGDSEIKCGLSCKREVPMLMGYKYDDAHQMCYCYYTDCETNFPTHNQPGQSLYLREGYQPVNSLGDGIVLPYEDHCYLLSNTKDTYNNAKLWCQNRKVELVIFETETEYTRMQTFVNTHGINKGFWTGGHDFLETGVYRWGHTGELVDLPGNIWLSNEQDTAKHCLKMGPPFYNRLLVTEDCAEDICILCEQIYKR